MLEQEPTHVYRGTWDEIVLHKDEIPSNTLIELRVYDVQLDTRANESSHSPPRNIADIIREIGIVEGLPADLSTNPKHMQGFGQTHGYDAQ